MKGIRLLVNLKTTKNFLGTVMETKGVIEVVPYPPKPGGFHFKVVRQESNGMFYAVCDLPGPSASDVVTQELTVKVTNGGVAVLSFGPDDLVTEEFTVGTEVGVEVECSLVDVDGSGNRSEARVVTGVVADTFAPPQPGEFNFRVTRQD